MTGDHGKESDAKGATEDDVERIDVIDGTEVLGYQGAGREEHSGENAPDAEDGMRDRLADNEPGDLERELEGES